MAGKLKFDGYLFCSDMDGTMAVTPENIAALEYFTKNGGRFTMASGRFPSHFREKVKGLPINAPVVAINGTVIYDLETDRLLWSSPMERRDVERVIRFGLTQQYSDYRNLYIYSASEGLTIQPDDAPDKVIETIYSTEALYPVMKFIVTRDPCISAELRSAYEQTFPDLAINQSWGQGFELHDKAGGKGNAVAKLRELLGGHEVIHTVVCAGDYENDLSMIEYADIGYAVGNATEQIKAAADRITVPFRENAIARIIEELA